MSIERRIIAAVKTLEAVRDNINRNGGKYSGTMAPNLQSIVDILTMPDAMVDELLRAAADKFECARASPAEIESLQAAWAGDGAP